MKESRNVLPESNRDLDYYQSYILGFEPSVTKLELTWGYIRWLQGKALLAFLNSSERKHGQYGELLRSIKMTKTTAHRCRLVAELWTEASARQIPFMQMVDQSKKQIPLDPEEPTVPKKPKSRGQKKRRDFRPTEILLKLDSLHSYLQAILDQPPIAGLTPEQAAEFYFVALGKLEGIGLVFDRLSDRYSELNKQAKGFKSETFEEAA